MTDLLFETLLDKYLVETITEEETHLFFSMLELPACQEQLKGRISRDQAGRIYEQAEDHVKRERIKVQLLENMAKVPEIPVIPMRKSFTIFRSRYAAAIVILLLGIGSYLLFFNRPPAGTAKIIAPSQQTGNDIAPGGNKAILTLADGHKVNLDNTGNGLIAQQGSSQAVKSQAGQLSYLTTHNPNPSVVLYNTLVTPRAGQYSLVLPDGTKVWLNNASSLRYPTAFIGKDRQVELNGEAYFEVAANPGQSFKVAIGSPAGEGGTVQVLGTHFNIMAYPDENAVKTTLLQGSVRFSGSGRQVVLKPDEQAQYKKEGGVKVVKDPDAKGEIGWKDGYFHYSSADIQTVLRQLSRWYDVGVTYQGKIPDANFEGDIQRNLPLSVVLEMLEKNQIGHFVISNGSVLVRPWNN